MVLEISLHSTNAILKTNAKEDIFNLTRLDLASRLAQNKN